MLYLTYSLIPSVDLAHGMVSHVKDLRILGLCYKDRL